MLLDPRSCGVCGTSFAPKMKSQRYCSRLCYTRAWHLNNPEKNAERQRLRRLAKPEWYAKHAPGYYRAYRGRHIVAGGRPWLYLLKSRKSEAVQRGLEFTLTDEWAVARWTGRCELTNILFEKNKTNGPWPFSPSLDRIDNSRGYTQDNARFILWGANALKGVGTDLDAARIAAALLINHGFTLVPPVWVAPSTPTRCG